MIYIIWILYGISAIIIVLYYERVLRETRDEYREKIIELNKQLAAFSKPIE
jgi:hypothetical protein